MTARAWLLVALVGLVVAFSISFNLDPPPAWCREFAQSSIPTNQKGC